MADPTTPYALNREERHLLTRIEALEEAVLGLEEQHQRSIGNRRVAWPLVGPLASVRRAAVRRRARLFAMGKKDRLATPRPEGSA